MPETTGKTSTRASRRLGALLLISIALLCGCTAHQRQVVRSTAALPKTVRVADAYTDQTLWWLDVPAGATLRLDTLRQRELRPWMLVNGVRGDARLLRWKLVRDRDWTVLDQGEVDVSGLRYDVKISVNSPYSMAAAGAMDPSEPSESSDPAGPAPPTAPVAPSTPLAPGAPHAPAATTPTPSTPDAMPEPLMITITADGKLYIDKQPIAPEDLKATLEGLATSTPGLTVVVRAMKDATLEQVTRVTTICADVGLPAKVMQPRQE